METAIKTFFTTPYFAVIGASPSPTKFGHKILHWYITHHLPVTPVNPTAPEVLGVACLESVRDLPHPHDTALSIVTPPNVTKSVLEQAVELGVKRVWLQPGTWEGGDGGELLKWARGVGLEVVAGNGPDGRWAGPEDEGACVLVHGEWGMRKAGRAGGKL